MKYLVLTLVALLSLSTHGKQKIFKPIENLDKKTLSPTGFEVTRDTENSIDVHMGPKDKISVQTCFESGSVTFFLHGSKGDIVDKGETIQDFDRGDAAYWDYKIYENKKSVRVNLIKKIETKSKGNQNGEVTDFWETNMKIIRASDDQPYLIKMIGVPCPDGLSNFPTAIHIYPKETGLDPERMLTADQLIAESTYGFDRKNLDNIQVGKMMATSGVSYVTLDMTVIPKGELGKVSDVEILVLDNYGTSKIKSDPEYLREYSKKAIKTLRRNMMKYALKVYVDKTYIMDSRYVNILYINKKTKTYQLIYQVDLLNRFRDLKVKENYRL